MPLRHVFTAKLQADSSGMTHVDVPASISKAIGRAKAPVEARIGRGDPFRETFMAAGDGHRGASPGDSR